MIGGGISSIGPVLWNGTNACPSISSGLDPLAPPLTSDVDDVSAAICESQNFIATRGGEVGIADPDEWFDPTHDGIRISVGMTPGLSIAMNDGAGNLFFAQGAARLDIVGHELWHTVMRSAGGPSAFAGYGTAEGGAIEEHLCDIFGTMLERRFLARRDNDCLLADDVQTQQAISMQNPDIADLTKTYQLAATR